MVVSTGVGGGLILDGRVLDGPTGNAGHVGHVVVDPVGPPSPAADGAASKPSHEGRPLSPGRASAGSPARTDRLSSGSAPEAGTRWRSPPSAPARRRPGAGRRHRGVGPRPRRDRRRPVRRRDLLFQPMRTAFDVHARMPFTRAGSASLLPSGPATPVCSGQRRSCLPATVTGRRTEPPPRLRSQLGQEAGDLLGDPFRSFGR